VNANDRKIFGTLFFSVFAAVMGVGIVVPLLPVYAHNLGASGIYIGLIFGAFSLSRIFFLSFFGRRSDKRGRKPFIVTGLFGYAVISLAFALSTEVSTLIVIRFVQGIASAMIMPVVLAYIGDITPPGREGWIMGLFNTSMFIGLSAGPLIGGVIKDRFSLQSAFLCMGALSLAGFLLSLVYLPATAREPAAKRKRPPVRWKTILADRVITGICFYRLAYTACIGIIWGFLPVFADSAFSVSASGTGILVMLGVFVSGIVQIPMGWLADRFNRKLMIIIGGIIVSVALYLFVRAQNFRDLLWCCAGFGIGGGIAMPALTAVAVMQGNRIGAMGSVMALLTTAHSLGMLLGAVMAGTMMDLFALRQAFLIGAACMSAGSILFIICTGPENLNQGQAPVPQSLPEG
jgi:MFS family permease